MLFASPSTHSRTPFPPSYRHSLPCSHTLPCHPTPYPGCRTLEDALAQPNLTNMVKAGLKYHIDFQRRIPRAEVAEAEGLIRDAFLEVLQKATGGKKGGREGGRRGGEVSLFHAANLTTLSLMSPIGPVASKRTVKSLLLLLLSHLLRPSSSSSLTPAANLAPLMLAQASRERPCPGASTAGRPAPTSGASSTRQTSTCSCALLRRPSSGPSPRRATRRIGRGGGVEQTRTTRRTARG